LIRLLGDRSRAGNRAHSGSAYLVDDPELGPFPQLWTLAELLWRLLSRSGHRFLLDHDLIDGYATASGKR